MTGLWDAVVSRKSENARALATAGADPWRMSLGGWSPGRLSLAGPTPHLFPVPDGVRLTDTERAAAEQADRLTTALGTFYCEGAGPAWMAGIDAPETVRRLEATPVESEVGGELLECPHDYDMDDRRRPRRYLQAREGRLAGLEVTIAALLVALGCNVGYTPVIGGADPLTRVRPTHFDRPTSRLATYRAANAALIDAQGSIPLAQVWAVDRHGTPLAIFLTGRNRHDGTQLMPLLGAIPRIRGVRGRPRYRPRRLFADPG